MRKLIGPIRTLTGNWLSDTLCRRPSENYLRGCLCIETYYNSLRQWRKLRHGPDEDLEVRFIHLDFIKPRIYSMMCKHLPFVCLWWPYLM